MHVAAASYELLCVGCRSRKEKRAVLRPITDTIRNRFKLSVAEVAHTETWQRSKIAVAVVAGSAPRVEELLAVVDRFVASRPDVEILSRETSWLDSEGSLAPEW